MFCILYQIQAKTHPFNIFVASENYKRGHGRRGKLKWEPERDIVEALECAFGRSISVSRNIKHTIDPTQIKIDTFSLV